jgi:hypothetical protein
MKRRHKFNAVAIEHDGIRFDSKMEARYYDILKAKQKAGKVAFFLRQVPLHISAKTRLVIDFQVFNEDGTVDFIDVKGQLTEAYKIKKREVELKYPIKIKEVKA